MKLYIRTDRDLLDLLDLNLSPTDRLRSATHVSFYPELPIFITNKVIILNEYYSDCESLISKFSINNTILNRCSEYNYDVIDYKNKNNINVRNLIKSSEVRVVRLDDVTISLV